MDCYAVNDAWTNGKNKRTYIIHAHAALDYFTELKMNFMKRSEDFHLQDMIYSSPHILAENEPGTTPHMALQIQRWNI